MPVLDHFSVKCLEVCFYFKWKVVLFVGLRHERRDIYSMAFWTLKRASSTPFVLMVVNQLIIP